MLHLITEPNNIAEVIRLPEGVKKARLKSTLKKHQKLINISNFLMDDPENGYPVTPCMNILKAKIHLMKVLINKN